MTQPGLHLRGAPARWAAIVHGGFLSAARQQDAEAKSVIRAMLAQAAQAAGALLERGAPGMDAVEAAIVILEDCPEFDAGRGSALTAAGRVEMDAAVMRGVDLAAGAVAGVTTVRNPIRAARAVLERTPHVMLQGQGADAFARAQGLEQADPSWFITERMRDALQSSQQQRPSQVANTGTVGCVVLDVHGQITAGTSTGGTTNKLPGRVGDSPLIGAGTWADSRWCGVSATGQGEFFIRAAAAHTVAALMEFTGADLFAAVCDVVHNRVKALQGAGGIIAVDPRGTLCATGNVPGLLYAGCTSAADVVTSLDPENG